MHTRMNTPEVGPNHDIDYVLYAYRTSRHPGLLGPFTPFEVLYGRPHNGFRDYAHCLPADTSVPASLLNRATEIRALVEGTHPAVVDQMKATKEAQRRQQDAAHAKQLIDTALPLGTVVYTRSLTLPRKLLGPRFHGPYKISRVTANDSGAPGNYFLATPRGSTLGRSYPLDQLHVVAEPFASNIWKQALEGARHDEIIFSADRLIDHRTYRKIPRWIGPKL